VNEDDGENENGNTRDILIVLVLDHLEWDDDEQDWETGAKHTPKFGRRQTSDNSNFAAAIIGGTDVV
jgi:hypothetical protein